MIIRSLRVTNFRNYDRFNITLGSKMNIFIGNNASGKTNILEAIAILGLTKSFRNGLDSDVIKFNRKKASIEGRILNNRQIKDLKIDFLDKNKDIYVNSKKVQKYADYLSNLNIIVFTPNDLDIIKGSPNIRRNLLNMTLSQISYSYLVTYNEYNKIYMDILDNDGKVKDQAYVYEFNMDNPMNVNLLGKDILEHDYVQYMQKKKLNSQNLFDDEDMFY